MTYLRLTKQTLSMLDKLHLTGVSHLCLPGGSSPIESIYARCLSHAHLSFMGSGGLA